MKIVFTLDDVIRAKTHQIGKIYQKYVDPDIDLSSLDLSSGNMQEILGFKNKKEYDKWLYEDYPFEVFAEAVATEKYVDKKLNLWLLSLDDNEDIEEDVEVALSNPYEYNASIGFTYFFLSKIATRIREVFFPTDSNEIWKRCDVLITADPKLLKSKDDENKIAIRIETDYNKDCQCDMSYRTLRELLDDEDFLNLFLFSLFFMLLII